MTKLKIIAATITICGGFFSLIGRFWGPERMTWQPAPWYGKLADEVGWYLLLVAPLAYIALGFRTLFPNKPFSHKIFNWQKINLKLPLGLMKKPDFLAIILGFLGASCAYLDSWRTASRFTAEGVRLGFGPELMTWWWRNIGQIGFLLIGMAFFIQAIVMITEKSPGKNKIRSGIAPSAESEKALGGCPGLFISGDEGAAVGDRISGGTLQDKVRTAEQRRRPNKMAQCQNKPASKPEPAPEQRQEKEKGARRGLPIRCEGGNPA